MADTDIVEFYPSPLCVHDRMREMFAGYGTCGSINVKPASPDACVKKKKRQSLQKSSYIQENLAVEFQCQTTRGCSNKLYATHPSCLLLPPNVCTRFLSVFDINVTVFKAEFGELSLAGINDLYAQFVELITALCCLSIWVGVIFRP